MPDFSAVNFTSLAFEEKLSDAKNKSFYLCKSSCKVTLCAQMCLAHRLVQFGSKKASFKNRWVLAVTRSFTSACQIVICKQLGAQARNSS